jgi:D-alanyl-D-alanine carboxypeptidase
MVPVMARVIAALSLLLAGACASAPPGDAGPWPPAEAERLGLAIDSLAAAVVERGEVVGLTVAVLRGGETVRARGYGIADLEHRAPATDSTRYFLGSVTKPMTAAAVLALAERGRLSLDDEVTRHVPELDSPGPPITLRHLLSHTSGLAGPQQVAPRFLERRHLEFSREQLVELLAGEPRVSAPGERFGYNNLGYILLGITVERVSGQGFEEHLRREVLAPAAASSVLLCDPRRVIAHRASGYEMVEGAPVNAEPVNASLVFAAGGLCANAPDVARWLRALAGGQVIAPATFREMVTPAPGATGAALSYGYGMFMDAALGRSRLFHGGDVNGFSGFAAHYPEAELTVVVLTNTRGTASRRLAEAIAGRVLGLPPMASLTHP